MGNVTQPIGIKAMVGERLDLSDDPADNRREAPSSRPFVGVHFKCCDTYARVYINRDRTAFEGHCPKCVRKIRLRIGPDGTSDRFFSAG